MWSWLEGYTWGLRETLQPETSTWGNLQTLHSQQWMRNLAEGLGQNPERHQVPQNLRVSLELRGDLNICTQSEYASIFPHNLPHSNSLDYLQIADSERHLSGEIL